MYWRGKRVKTKEYMDYQNEIRDEMMGIEWPFSSDQVSFMIDIGLSARQADLDNIMKPLFDTFQNIYEEFNDNKVYHVDAIKTIVPKGEEYLRVVIERIEDEDRVQELWLERCEPRLRGRT